MGPHAWRRAEQEVWSPHPKPPRPGRGVAKLSGCICGENVHSWCTGKLGICRNACECECQSRQTAEIVLHCQVSRCARERGFSLPSWLVIGVVVPSSGRKK